MSKHTPGPWKVASPKESVCLDQKEDRLICTTVDKHLYHIAETFQYRNTEFNNPDGVSLANARLVAAAPELLGACRKYVELMEKASRPNRTQDEIGRIGHELDAIMDAAIAKVK